jgi:sarcosine oxidase
MIGPSYDVIVVGLGGMGSAAAYHLAGRGQRVLGLERFGPVHDRGSSHGGSRLIRQTCFEDPAYVPLVRRAYALWDELQQHSVEPILLSTGGLLLGSPDSAMIRDARAVAAGCGVPHEILIGEDVRRRFPPLIPDDDTVAFFEPTAGVVRPEVAVATHLRLARGAGADLHFAEAVTGWSAGPGSGITVVTDRATYRAGRLVVCPGGWAPSLLGEVGVPFSPQRLVVTRFQPLDGVTAFLPERHPFWLWDIDSGGAPGFPGFLYGAPALDGPHGGVKLSRVQEEPCCADTVDRVVGAAEIEEVAAALRPRLGVPLGPVVDARVCLWTNTPDHHFVLGAHPEHPDVIVAAGCSGHAFKFIPVIGEILADLAADGKTAHSIALFEPGRGGTVSRPPTTPP